MVDKLFDWRLEVVEPDRADNRQSQLRTLVSFGPAARDALGRLAPGTRIALGIEVGPDGVATALNLPGDFVRAAREAGLQLRVELVADGYDKRHVDFAKIHGVHESDLASLAEALALRQGARVLDLGCGYGEVSINILAEADRRGLGIELTPCDLHEAQLSAVPQDIKARAMEVVVGDARALPFPEGHFDSVVMKMVLHEIPIWDQPMACAEVLRVLRPGGVSVVWGVMPQDGEVQDVFNKIMQLKNALSGYESLV